MKLELPLFGELIGVKDNMDTFDLPTGYGSLVYAGHRPSNDAVLIARLRAAGALVAGKTACAEFAWMTPPATENPAAPGRTPGGSSSGSAAAVAAGHVRLATGSQTAGSINRPASYCGIVGFKPSFGLLPRDGVRVLSPVLDTVGYLAATVADVRRVLGRSVQKAGRGGRVGFLRTPDWHLVNPEARAAIEMVAEGCDALPVVVPDGYAELCDAHRTIQFYDSARSLAAEFERDTGQLSEQLRAALAEGAAISRVDRARAIRVRDEHAPALIDWLGGFDAVITPSVDGPPPEGLEFTGDPLFNRVWTLIGAPCLSLPLAWTADGLPVGLQLVGAPGSDDLVLERGRMLSP